MEERLWELHWIVVTRENNNLALVGGRLEHGGRCVCLCIKSGCYVRLVEPCCLVFPERVVKRNMGGNAAARQAPISLSHQLFPSLSTFVPGACYL